MTKKKFVPHYYFGCQEFRSDYSNQFIIIAIIITNYFYLDEINFSILPAPAKADLNPQVAVLQILPFLYYLQIT